MSNNSDVKKILELVELKDLDAINALIRACVDDAEAAIMQVCNLSQSLGVNCRLQQSDVARDFIYKKLGVSGLNGAVGGWHILFYAVRDSIWGWYSLLGSQSAKGGIKFFGDPHLTRGLDWDLVTESLVQEYQNGNSVYVAHPDILERIEIVIQIENIFQGRAYPKR